MKLRVTIEFDVKETERGFDVMDSDNFCVCFGGTLQEAVDDLRQMIEQDAMNPITVEVIDVIPTLTFAANAGHSKGELPPPYTPPKYRGDA